MSHAQAPVAKAGHAHELVLVEDGIEVTLRSSGSDGRSHVHEFVHGGRVLRTEPQDGAGIDHRHVVVDGEASRMTSSMITPDPVSITKSLVPDVLTYEAVRKGEIPELGTSGLPSSLESQVPARYRYWLAKSVDDARAVRDALVEAALFTDESLGQVSKASGDLELRRLIEVVDIYVAPDEPDGEVEVPVLRAGVERAATSCGFGTDAVRVEASLAGALGVTDVVDRLARAGGDWVVEVDNAAADAVLKSAHGPLVWASMSDDAHVYVSSSAPLGPVRWSLERDLADEVEFRSTVLGVVAKDASSMSRRMRDLVEIPEWTEGQAREAATLMRRVRAEIATSTDQAAAAERLGVDPEPPLARVVKRLASLVPIRKDAQERFVLGVVMEPEVDAHDEIASAQTIYDACHQFMLDFGDTGLQHREVVTDSVRIVENYIARADEVIEGQVVKAGSWVMGVIVLDDEIWEAIEKGDLTGFSIGGFARRRPVKAAEARAA